MTTMQTTLPAPIIEFDDGMVTLTFHAWRGVISMTIPAAEIIMSATAADADLDRTLPADEPISMTDSEDALVKAREFIANAERRLA